MPKISGKYTEQLDMADGISREWLTVRELSKLLSVSSSTVKNWIRLKKIRPDMEGDQFSRKYAERLQSELGSRENHQLKSRRNKSKATGRLLYKEYVGTSRNQKAVGNILKADVIKNEHDLRLVLAYFSLQLYGQSRGIPCDRESILNCLTGRTGIRGEASDHTEENVEILQGSHSEFLCLIMDLIEGMDIGTKQMEELSPAFDQELVFVNGEDTLGFVYLSLRDISQRKSTGAYYTPAKIVQKMMDYLQDNGDLSSEKSFFDPCCGTGNFLLGLASRGVSPELLFGQDLDDISVCLTRINLALINSSFQTADLYAQIRCGNTLKEKNGQKYHVILGNPPWGSMFDEEDIRCCRQSFKTARGKTIESYDVFIEKSLSMLKADGTLSFVLPEAILTVASHNVIRQILGENCAFRFVSYLGDVFSGVQCPSVILGVSCVCNKKPSINTEGCKVYLQDRSFVIKQEREWSDGTFAFHMSDEEEECLNAIENIPDVAYLKDHARFALGIVTGNNREFISEEKRDGYEIILKGSDIRRYRIAPAGHYIRYTPGHFQQTASTEMYRAEEKLVYRFISASPVFAYDKGRHLTLNSCNILIPEIHGLSMKYILAVLNSRVIAFFLQKRFRSVKLLRSHIEAIPIPPASDEEQEAIIKCVDRILCASGDIGDIEEELDEQIFQLFSLSKGQIDIIKNNCRR